MHDVLTEREAADYQRVTLEEIVAFLKAVDIARQQQAKSWELRAVMSLVRLRQQQAMLQVSRSTHHTLRFT